MTYISTQTNSSKRIKTLKRGDRGFTICTDGLSITPRAGLQISLHCPIYYKEVIEQCVKNGWLEPVAFITEGEFVWSELQK